MKSDIRVINPEIAVDSGLSQASKHSSKQIAFIDWFITALLAMGAFVPRYLFAVKLDVSTDEPIYTIAGNIYISLIRDHNLNSIRWTYNFEHPAFAKLLMGLSVFIAKQYLHSNQQLLAARIPEVVLGSGMIVAIYLLGRAPFGRGVSLLAAMCLLVSPWVIYFNAQALLDTTMTTLVTLAYLLLWHATRRPALYLLLAVLIGLATASKYPAVLVLPGIFLYLAYYYFGLNRRLPTEERVALPWKWWLLALGLAPLIFFLADPSIWANPLPRLIASYQFSLTHAEVGHRSFWAGQIATHQPGWMILYLLGAKLSAFVTIPAAIFVLFLAPYRLYRFHTMKQEKKTTDRQEVESIALLFAWLGSCLVMFSRLTIVVGTHYYLPLAAPVALAAATTLVSLLKYRRGNLLIAQSNLASASKRLNPLALVKLSILGLVLIGPHLVGLLTIPGLDGYTSEFFHGEDSTLQVAYNGYREADQWLLTHTKTGGQVAIVGGSATTLWYIANPARQDNLTFTVVVPSQINGHASYDYLVWPKNLEQRNEPIPANWSSHIVHVISGGDTTYCYILARNPASLKT